MAKKDLKAAAEGALTGLRASQPQRMIDDAQNAAEEQAKKKTKKPKSDRTAPFTIWTTPENAQHWKQYQKAKRQTFPTQAEFVETAINEYIAAHPITDADRDALLKSLGF